MKVKQSHGVRFLQKVMILVFLSFLAYGEKNTMVAAVMNKKFASVVLEKQQMQQKQQHGNHHHHSMDLFSSSKRRVPNASDPLHNR